MKLAIHIFAYLLDSDILMRSLTSITRHLRADAGITVWQQHNAPITPAARAHCEALGVAVQTTKWPRNGNLNGIDAVNGILDCYESVPADYALKIDPDVLILRNTRLDGLFDKDALFCTHIPSGTDKKISFGFFYALKPTLIPAMRKLPWPTLLPLGARVPEDATMRAFLDAVGADVRDVPYAGFTGVWCSWRPTHSTDHLDRVDMVNLGNIPDGTAKPDARALAVSTADYLLGQNEESNASA